MAIDLDQWNERMRARWTPLRDQCAFAARRGDQTVGLRDAARFEVGSAYKAFVAAEYARQAGAGLVDPEMEVAIQPDDRVDGSEVTAQVPDGGMISLQGAAEAMVSISDNTAADLLVRVLGTDRIRALLTTLGLTDTSIPDSTRAIYDRIAANRAWRPEVCLTTMRDITTFYTATVANQALGNAGASNRFLDLMEQEDQLQGTTWPDGVTCYRKTGLLEPPPMLVMGMGGAFVNGDSDVTAFAFALNVDFPEDAAVEESPLEPIVRTFSEGLRRGMHELVSEQAP